MSGKVHPVVYRQGPRRPGDVYQGTRPKPGNVLDAEGRLILVHEYGPPPCQREPSPPAEPERPVPRISRGVISTEERKLL
jgi:hypothetical protein